MLLARHARAIARSASSRQTSRASKSYSVREKEGVDGRDGPGHDALKNFQKGRVATSYAASAALAFSAIAWNAAGSVMARSDSTLRSTVMPDFDRPLMKTL
jgi:hypothetical protein